MNGIFRRVFDPLLFGPVDVRRAVVPAGGERGPVLGRGRDERRGSTLPHLQGCRIFGLDDGLLGERLLHHHRGLDLVLHLQRALLHRLGERVALELLR